MKNKSIISLIIVLLLSGCLDFTLGVKNHIEKKTGGMDTLVTTTGDNIIKASELSRWTYAANGGDAEAQYHMGKAFCCGKRPYYNTYDALKWFCKAAKQGQRDAMLEIGKIYDNAQKDDGSMIPRDNVLAYVYFKKAVEHGNEKALSFQEAKAARLNSMQKQKAQNILEQWPEIQCEIH